MTRARLRAAARKILRAGLRAVEPEALVRSHLSVRGRVIHAGGFRLTPERVFVVAVGKAAVPMARGAHRALGERLTSAIVIAPTKPPYLPRTEGFEAGHPVPDAKGISAARRVIQMLQASVPGDLILLLLSGGASSLMPAPVPGVSLRDKQRLTRLLLRGGASISELNAVRKSLSRLKGGGFAHLARKARVVTLALSDVPGDDPGVIGSGPCVHDPGARDLARRTVRRLLKGVVLPRGVSDALAGHPQAPGLGPAPRLKIMGSGRTFARAAGLCARELGFRVRLAPDALHGEARLRGPALVGVFRSLEVLSPLCYLATGETVVNVRGKGRGGRNQELALASVPALASVGRPLALAAFATDGVDGNSTASGGLVDDQTERRARRLSVSIREALDRNDSNSALDRLGCLLATGPTGTNVADVALLLG